VEFSDKLKEQINIMKTNRKTLEELKEGKLYLARRKTLRNNEIHHRNRAETRIYFDSFSKGNSHILGFEEKS